MRTGQSAQQAPVRWIIRPRWRMDRKTFAETVDAARTAHPVWFDLPSDALASDSDLERVSRQLGVELPGDYAWFLREYGGGDFGLATVHAADEYTDCHVVDRQPGEPAQMPAFSDYGAGDRYVFPVEDGVAADEILWLDHETGELTSSERGGFLGFLARTGLRTEQEVAGRVIGTDNLPMAEVTIYTQPRCLHCFRAKRRLRQRGASIREIKSSRDLDRTRSELRDRFGADTFPQIIIGERPWQSV